MVQINGNQCYFMGTPDNADERRINERYHRVCVGPFKIAKYEVTNREFRRYRPEHNSNLSSNHSLNDDNKPVVGVSWHDAYAYTQWLSMKTGRLYRLPTEAEWEYAVRAGTTTSRYWGDHPNSACTYANVKDLASKTNASGTAVHNCDDRNAITAPVGTYRPNALGIYDMLGNVWEWTYSPYSNDYNNNEVRWASSTQNVSIAVRGGAWTSGPEAVRSAYREGLEQDIKRHDLGFRVVLDE